MPGATLAKGRVLFARIQAGTMDTNRVQLCPQCGAVVFVGELCPTRSCPTNLKTALARPLLRVNAGVDASKLQPADWQRSEQAPSSNR
jgi:hypothetical protein